MHISQPLGEETGGSEEGIFFGLFEAYIKKWAWGGLAVHNFSALGGIRFFGPGGGGDSPHISPPLGQLCISKGVPYCACSIRNYHCIRL